MAAVTLTLIDRAQTGTTIPAGSPIGLAAITYSEEQTISGLTVTLVNKS